MRVFWTRLRDDKLDLVTASVLTDTALEQLRRLHVEGLTMESLMIDYLELQLDAVRPLRSLRVRNDESVAAHFRRLPDCGGEWREDKGGLERSPVENARPRNLPVSATVARTCSSDWGQCIE